jgi:hypothetical protein
MRQPSNHHRRVTFFHESSSMPPLILLRLGLYGAVILAIFGAGWHFGSSHTGSAKDAEISGLTSAYDERIHAADTALQAANQHAADVEHATQVALADADTQHAKEVANANAKSAALVASYRSGEQRLRYYQDAAPNAASRSSVSSPAAASSGSDDRVEARLSGRVSGDLSSLMGDANVLQARLSLAQATIRAYYKACGPQS